MIVSLHVATGAALGAAVRSRPLALLAARRGPLDPAVVGGAAASMPDLEHIVPWLRVRGEKVFHRGGGRHGVGISAERQLLLAGTVVGLLLGRR